MAPVLTVSVLTVSVQTGSVLAASALASWSLLGLLLPWLRRRLLDQPNARSAHRRPTPRGGGLAFVLVAVAASLLALATTAPSQPAPALLWLPLLALPLALVGVLDDRHNLPAGLRYAIQLATAVALLLASPLARSLPPQVGLLPFTLLLPLLLLVITAVINFTNFLDGLDGLVAGCMAVALAAAALRLNAPPAALWPLVGALLGFLVWNWSPARVFMGDVGSTFLGAVYAAVVLQASGWSEALGLLLLATPLLADGCLCVLRRLRAGQPVFQAHRLHLFQRLHQAGWSHRRVAGLYITATVLLAAALTLGGLLWLLAGVLLQLAIGLWLDQRRAVPFAVAAMASPPPPGASSQG